MHTKLQQEIEDRLQERAGTGPIQLRTDGLHLLEMLKRAQDQIDDFESRLAYSRRTNVRGDPQ